MHDGLAQVLGYLNLQVQTIEALYIQEKENEFQRELVHMRNSIRNAQADIRENILSLRTTLASNLGLISSIEEYLKEFSIQTAIETVFNNSIGADLQLASLCEVQLVCILQEALTNVRKHAQATNVEINLSKVEDGNQDKLILEVFDNGIGFEITEKTRRFGLKTMRERAESVKADFEIISSANQGTRVRCAFPCLEQETAATMSRVFN
jgi:two-component system nitrate/nitrite sensor histidine kinase NarX